MICCSYAVVPSPDKATELWVTEQGVYFDRLAIDPMEVKIFYYDFEAGTCEYRFSTDVSYSRVGLADDLVTGVELTDGGLRVVLKDFAGNVLVDDLYALELGKPDPSVDVFFLGRDNATAFYAIYNMKDNSVAIVTVALDGGGAKILCTQGG